MRLGMKHSWSPPSGRSRRGGSIHDLPVIELLLAVEYGPGVCRGNERGRAVAGSPAAATSGTAGAICCCCCCVRVASRCCRCGGVRLRLRLLRRNLELQLGGRQLLAAQLPRSLRVQALVQPDALLLVRQRAQARARCAGAPPRRQSLPTGRGSRPPAASGATRAARVAASGEWRSVAHNRARARTPSAAPPYVRQWSRPRAGACVVRGGRRRRRSLRRLRRRARRRRAGRGPARPRAG